MKKDLHQKISLARRLTGYAASSGALLLVAGQANGQVEYSGPQNLQITLPEDYLNLDMDGDGIDDFRFIIYGYASSFSGTNYGNSYISNNSFAYAAVYNANSGNQNSWITRIESVEMYSGTISQMQIADGLSSGMPVAGGASWGNLDDVSWEGVLGVRMDRYFLSPSYDVSIALEEGLFVGEEKFLGVRFLIGDEQHYGWIRLVVSETINTLTVIDWAYQSTPDLAIIAGDGLGTDLPPYMDITGYENSNLPLVSLTILATEEVTGFDASDIIIANGTASNFTEVTAGFEYTLDVTAAVEGEVQIRIPEEAVTDLTGNSNYESVVTWTYDITPPEVQIQTYIDTTSNRWISGAIIFSEPVTTLEFDGLTITNGALQYLNFAGNVEGTDMYYFEIYADSDGESRLQVNTGAVTDMAGNPCELASTSWHFDGTPPEVILSVDTDATTESAMVVDVLFDEPVTSLSRGDFNVQNGNAVSLETLEAGTHYSLTVEAAGTGIVIVSLESYQVWDAAGNSNEATSMVAWHYNPLDIETELSQATVIYPNPAHDMLQIQTDKPVSISMYDAQGSLILQEGSILNEGIDISGLRQGIYLLKVQDEEEVFYRKLLIR